MRVSALRKEAAVNTFMRTARRRKLKPATSSLLLRGAIGLALFLVVMAALSKTGHAQQTIFNVPTTDVLDKGKVYFELDVSAKPNDSAAVNKFSSFVPRLVAGAGHRVEVGLNITGNLQPGPDSTTLVPTVKWKAYQGQDNGVAVVFGDNIFIPVRNRGYNAGNYVYAERQPLPFARVWLQLQLRSDKLQFAVSVRKRFCGGAKRQTEGSSD